MITLSEWIMKGLTRKLVVTAKHGDHDQSTHAWNKGAGVGGGGSAKSATAVADSFFWEGARSVERMIEKSPAGWNRRGW